MKKNIYAIFISAVILFTFTYSETKAEAAAATISDEAASGNFVSYLTEQLLNYSTKIDVTNYLDTGKITFEQLAELWYGILKTDIRLYHVDSKLSYVYSTAGVKSNVIKDIKYNTPKTDYQKNLKLMKEEINGIVSVAKPWMTDVEKALAVHDYLVLSYKYDSTLSKYSMKNLLVDKTAVCEGYASVFSYVMNELGIVCKLVLSEEINHIWNMVKIDGNWYHIDVTWDDPVPDVLGYVSHANFLLNDKEAEATGHKGWNKKMFEASNSTVFKNAFWKEINSEIIIRSDFYYYSTVKLNGGYFKSAYILKKSRNTGKMSSVLQFNYNDLPKIPVFPVRLYNGKLYFQTANGVFCMSLSGKNITQIVGKSGLQGMSIDRGRISYALSDNSIAAINIKEANAESIKLDKTSIIIQKGLQAKINALLPDGCKDYVYWESDNPDVVYCGSSGMIKAMSTGRTIIRAYTDSGVYAECRVEVKN